MKGASVMYIYNMLAKTNCRIHETLHDVNQIYIIYRNRPWKWLLICLIFLDLGLLFLPVVGIDANFFVVLLEGG